MQEEQAAEWAAEDTAAAGGGGIAFTQRDFWDGSAPSWRGPSMLLRQALPRMAITFEINSGSSKMPSMKFGVESIPRKRQALLANREPTVNRRREERARMRLSPNRAMKERE